MNSNKAITYLEQAVKFKLSDEQLNIVTADWNEKLVVNACAGAGKTTVLILRLLYKELTENVTPAHWICITFSKLAQREMLERYREIKKNLLENDIELTNDEPTFRTIHALFLELAQNYGVIDSTATNIDGFTPYHKSLKPIIEKMSSTQKYDMYTAYNVYNNWRITEEVPKNVFKASMNLLDTEYTKQKEVHNSYDFVDILVKTLKAIVNGNTEFINVMKYYTDIVIDEFQDIDALQWTLLLRLFPEQTTNHLSVIGDLNQNIYSFRGSMSGIMKDLSDKNTTHSLITNYRTSEDILNIATKMLKADVETVANRKNGLITSHKLNQTDINEITQNIAYGQSYAVLSRYHNSLSRVQDYLLFQGIGITPTTERNYFVNNAMFKMIIDTIMSIRENNISKLMQTAKYFGFTPFETHIRYYINMLHGDLREYFRTGYTLMDNQFTSAQNAKRRKVVTSLISIAKQIDKNEFSNVFYQLKLLAENYMNMLKHVNKVLYDKFNEDFAYLNSLYGKVTSFNDLKDLVNQQIDRWENHEYYQPRIATLTIHQAKGLEFDNVILSDVATFKALIKDPREYARSAEDVSEERRIMYVGVTRAKNRLQIIG